MKLTSPDIKHGERLPDRLAFDHQNQSPTLAWSELPEGTKELAIICDDPDAPMGTWVHWVIYGIPASIGILSGGIPKKGTLDEIPGACQGKNGWGNIGYDGPRPPRGPSHRYFFKLYALKEQLKLGPGLTASQLQKAMKGKTLAEAELMGTYSR